MVLCWKITARQCHFMSGCLLSTSYLSISFALLNADTHTHVFTIILVMDLHVNFDALYTRPYACVFYAICLYWSFGNTFDLHPNSKWSQSIHSLRKAARQMHFSVTSEWMCKQAALFALFNAKIAKNITNTNTNRE